MKVRVNIYFLLCGALFLLSISSSFQLRSENLSLADKKERHPLWMGVETFNDEVKANETFADLLRKYRVDAAAMNVVLKNYSHVYNPARLIKGDAYTVVSRAVGDTVLPPEYMSYQINDVSYLEFKFDGANSSVEKISRPIVEEERLVSGIVEGSLWETFENNDINPAMASQLADIYAYTLNFFKMQRGDRFKILFTEKIVDGESLEITGVKAVMFNYHGKDYFAFHYADASGRSLGYFDEDGRSLKMRFLMAPVKYSRISSRYNTHRLHPVTGVVKGHFGTDFAAAYGTPIYSTADGIVTEARFKQYNGNYVKIKHDKTYTTQYLHMSKFAKGMKPGAHVIQGQIIGYVGSTGLATGPHVCYRFWKNDKQVDPFRELGAKSMPMPDNERKTYLAKISSIKDKLASIGFDNPLAVKDTISLQTPFTEIKKEVESPKKSKSI